MLSCLPVLGQRTGKKAVESPLKSNNFFLIALWLGCTYKSELIYGRVCMRMRVCAWWGECAAACACVHGACVWACASECTVGQT